ncbi:nucleoside-diphosphate-sugar epimerase [Kushneria sinocarnis]|uniref:Nucleoside-diphosphate-sugar epimerase n=1 Tax=Kushneria sinocarnis TaxID=595502 RepID=A0A420X0A3_9GAMM|nr:NAD-dependent epimerase/dehydratase family protein [Kushneria sinocarnis]RKR06947.1 nucleoside-diphosphate-sugar epimerase [Kushneria sinocarnis]
MRCVAVTGATGFIGSVLCPALERAGYRVQALTRRERRDSERIHWIRGGLDDRQALKSLVTGADCVIHCAGAVRGADYESFHEINAAGTQRVFEAARSEGCAHLLLLSSLAAREPALSWYARSKQAAEQELDDHGTPSVTIFRPPAVYGPGDRELRPLFELMLRGIMPIAGAPKGRLTVIHVHDLVQAILAWLRRPATGRGPFELHDGAADGYTWPQIAALAARMRQGRVLSLPLPETLLRALARSNLMLARCTGRTPMLTPGKVNELRHPDWRCDNTAISAALDWQPTITLERALAEPGLWRDPGQ